MTSFIFIGFSIVDQAFWDTPMTMETPKDAFAESRFTVALAS